MAGGQEATVLHLIFAPDKAFYREEGGQRGTEAGKTFKTFSQDGMP